MGGRADKRRRRGPRIGRASPIHSFICLLAVGAAACASGPCDDCIVGHLELRGTISDGSGGVFGGLRVDATVVPVESGGAGLPTLVVAYASTQSDAEGAYVVLLRLTGRTEPPSGTILRAVVSVRPPAGGPTDPSLGQVEVSPVTFGPPLESPPSLVIDLKIPSPG